MQQIEIQTASFHNSFALLKKKKHCQPDKKINKNQIKLQLNEEDFVEAEMLEDLELGHNSLKSLGGDGSFNSDGTLKLSALYPLKALKCLNLTHNQLTEFSFTSLRGLRELRMVDLSSNQIGRLTRARPPTEVIAR